LECQKPLHAKKGINVLCCIGIKQLVGDVLTGTANDFVASVKRVVPGRRKTTAVPAVFLCCADRRKITGCVH